jgi:hypothetical protein
MKIADLRYGDIARFLTGGFARMRFLSEYNAKLGSL